MASIPNASTWQVPPGVDMYQSKQLYDLSNSYNLLYRQFKEEIVILQSIILHHFYKCFKLDPFFLPYKTLSTSTYPIYIYTSTYMYYYNITSVHRIVSKKKHRCMFFRDSNFVKMPFTHCFLRTANLKYLSWSCKALNIYSARHFNASVTRILKIL